MSDPSRPQETRPLFTPPSGVSAWKRAHSIAGVFPVGVFVVFHLLVTARAVGGREHFDRAVRAMETLPLLPVIEALILGPLAFHAVVGVMLVAQARRRSAAAPRAASLSAPAWRATLQRATGVITLLFLIGHLYALRVPHLLGRLPDELFYQALTADLSTTTSGVPWIALGYVVGLAATVFHLAHGLSSFATSWGLVRSAAGRRRARWGLSLLGVTLFALGTSTALYFATGVRVLGPPPGTNPFAPRPSADLPFPAPTSPSPPP